MRPPHQPTNASPADEHAANPGYAADELARALMASEHHEDAGVRARSLHKVDVWSQVLRGMLSGDLRIGSRVPVTGIPAWATLEVVQGGFATGNLVAGGELQPHEREAIALLPAVAPGRERARLNGYFLGDAGLDELTRLLETGCYDVRLPEEGALLVVAWLVRADRAELARDLLDEIAPLMSRLRFYPAPSARPASASTSVHLQDVGTTVTGLEAIKPAERFLTQK